MSIKNPHIIHFVRKGRYICIGTCTPTKEKSTKRKNTVTCINCIKILEKER